MSEKTATRKPGVDRRAEQMAQIVKSHEKIVDQEMRDGGTAEGISVLARDNPVDGAVAVVKPDGVDQGEWDKLGDEAKAGLAEAEAERLRVEAEAASAARAGETDDAKAEREAKEREEAEAKRKADEAAAAAAAGAPKKKVKIVVDGVEQEVDEDQVRRAGIATLQKESAADKRLEEASRLFKEAQAAIASAQAGVVQDPNKGGASLPAAAGGGAVEVLTDAAFTEAVKKIQYGSEAEAAATLKDLITKAARAGQPEQLTLDRVAEMLDFRDATRWAHDEYKDILGDSKMKALFVSEEKRLRAAGDMRPYREIYEDIGNGLREWRKGIAPAPALPAGAGGTSREKLQERKASVVVIPSAAARQATPPQTKEPTPSETIDKMRAARRQA